MSPVASEEFIAGVAGLSVGHDGRSAPSGWRWVKLTDIAKLESGHTPSRKHPEYWGGSVPWISIPDARIHHGGVIAATEQTITEKGLANSPARWLPKDTVCLSRTASVGYVIRLGRPMATSQDFVNWVCGPALDPRYLMYALMAEGKHLREFGKGSTHTTIYFPEALAFHLALPSLAEQKRIVARVEELLTQVDSARASLGATPAILRRFRQSVLAAACAGKLTEDWRAKNSPEPIDQTLARVVVRESNTGRAATDEVIPGKAILSVGQPDKEAPPGWKWMPLTDIAKLESGHTPSRKHPEYWDGKFAWIGILDAGAHHGGVINDTGQTITQAGLDNSAARLLPAGTVCLSRTASVGYVVIMGRTMATSQDFVNWVCTEALVPEFLMYALMAEGADIKRFGRGSTHTTIYYPEVKALHIGLPPVDEQREIVRRIVGVLSVADDIAATVDRAAQRADKITQAVLAKAFRGELVSTEAELAAAEGRTYETAEQLLARVRAEAETAPSPKARTPRKRLGKREHRA